MPGMIQYIDAIGRKKGRAVLYLEFHPQSFGESRHYRFETDPMRISVTAWLYVNEIPWQECGPFADPSVMVPYLGQIYPDLLYDEYLAEYRSLRDYLEHPDGTMRHPGIRFYALPLDDAMQNAEHDEPGFWTCWAEHF